MGTRARLSRRRVLSRCRGAARLLHPVATAVVGRALMLRVERITLREIRLPLKEPFRISSGLCTERRICVLELTSADGVTAWSECVAGEQPNYSDETIDTAWLALPEGGAPRLLPEGVPGAGVVGALPARELSGPRLAPAAGASGGLGAAGGGV